VRDFNLVKVSLFVFHNTDTFYLPPRSVLTLFVLINSFLIIQHFLYFVRDTTRHFSVFLLALFWPTLKRQTWDDRDISLVESVLKERSVQIFRSKGQWVFAKCEIMVGSRVGVNEKTWPLRKSSSGLNKKNMKKK
jgi:hypothetical protein